MCEPRAPLVIGASVAGRSHVRRGIVCQDAFAVRVGEGRVAVAVADGLGTAPRSDLGAATATAAAAARALETAACDEAEAAMEGAVAARMALEELAGGEALAPFACTLLVAVAGRRLGVAHIGDGAAVALSQDAPFLLSPPGPSEYLNETDALTSTGWRDNVRSISTLDPVEGFALFTDGCQHAALHCARAHAGFFAPLFDFARRCEDEDDGSAALAELLGGAKMSEHSDDDKTLVLAVMP